MAFAGDRFPEFGNKSEKLLKFNKLCKVRVQDRTFHCFNQGITFFLTKGLSIYYIARFYLKIIFYIPAPDLILSGLIQYLGN